jgi:hypothetical protein
MFEVNYIAVLVAGVVNLVLGMIWYAPRVFGSAWMRMSNITPDMVERGKKTMPLMAFTALVAGVIMAYVLSFFAISWGVFDVIGATELAFWTWLGFMAPVLMGSVLWEQKPLKLYFLNAGYWLVGLIVMAQILLLMA